MAEFKEKFTLNNEEERRKTEPDLLAKTRAQFEDIAEDNYQKILQNAVEFSPEILALIQDAKRWHIHRYASMGIDASLPKFTDRVLQVSKTSADNKNIKGRSSPGFIEIVDLSKEVLEPVQVEDMQKETAFVPIPVPVEIIPEGLSPAQASVELRNYLQAQDIIHELYHDSAPLSFFVQTKTDADGNPSHHFSKKTANRQGIAYSSHTVGDPALEEALAMKVVQEADQMIAEHFPQGREVYDALIKYIIKVDSRIAGEYEPQWLHILNFDGNAVKYAGAPYLNSQMGMDILVSQIPDIIRRIEHARLTGKTLDLARTIEGKFGQGAYKKLVTASEETIFPVLQDMFDSK